LNSWSSHHPGGELVISHYVGRDATDELDAYHSDDTLKRRVPKFCVGTLAQEEKDVSLSSPTILLSSSQDHFFAARRSRKEVLVELDSVLIIPLLDFLVCFLPSVFRLPRPSYHARIPAFQECLRRCDLDPSRRSSPRSGSFAIPSTTSSLFLLLACPVDSLLHPPPTPHSATRRPLSSTCATLPLVLRDPKSPHDGLPDASSTSQRRGIVHGAVLGRLLRRYNQIRPSRSFSSCSVVAGYGSRSGELEEGRFDRWERRFARFVLGVSLQSRVASFCLLLHLLANARDVRLT